MSKWIQTYTGQRFWPLEPKLTSIRFKDIKMALSHLCRFNGHCREYYSIAQHSVLLARYMMEADKEWTDLACLHGLLHDAHEAYISDIPGPIRDNMYIAHESKVRPYVIHADAIQAQICRDLEIAPIDSTLRDIIFEYDQRMLATEKRDVMMHCQWEWLPLPDPFEDQIEPWTPGVAATEFQLLYDKLKGRINATIENETPPMSFVRSSDGNVRRAGDSDT